MSRPREESGLYKHPSGLWYWRRVDPKTGRRKHRSTGTRRKDMAVRKAAQFEDEWEKAAAGMATYDWARVDLRSLIDDWLTEQRVRQVSERTQKQRKAQLLRTLDVLRLSVIADLCDVGALDRRLRGVGEPLVTLQRGYQMPLKLFAAWLAENNRYTDRNLLLTWKKLQVPKGEAPRRAMLPNEVARALDAADELDAYHRRKHPTRPVLLALLVTAPRATAFCTRDVEHLLEARIDFGEGQGNKRNGWGALDARTAEDLRAYVGARKRGPLFLSTTGARFDPLRLLDVWREAFGLGVLNELLPGASLEDRILANRTLLHGKAPVNKGGSRLKETTLARLTTREREIVALAEAARVDWTERMKGVDVHAFRKTHQTWAEAQGVPAVLIDKQLGHALAGGAQLDVFRAVRAMAGSTVGRKHYLDLGSKLLDPTPSADAVRMLLDQALAALGIERRPVAGLTACQEAVDPTKDVGRTHLSG